MEAAVRRILALLLLVCLAAVPSFANQKLSGWTESGGVSVVIPGTQGSGTQRFQQSFRNATVTVYAAGTTNLSTIYSNNLATPTAQANPFTASSSGFWSFYASSGRYDVKFSGGGITTPFTIGDFLLFDYADAKNSGSSPCLTTGTNFGTKFTAAAALLPSTGGIVDCSNLQGAQSFTTDVFSSQTKPILLIPPTGAASNTVSFSIPSTMTVDFPQGGSFVVASGTTATINGEVRGTTSQHFAGSGSTVFGSATRTPAIYPQWYGALGDDSTDNSSAFTAMVAGMSAGVNTGFHVAVPPGIYRFTTGVVFPNTGGPANSLQKLSLTFDCAGPTESVFKWMSAGGTMFSLARNGQNAQPLNFHKCGFTNAGSGATIGLDMTGSYLGVVDDSRFLDFGKDVVLGMGSSGAYYNTVENNMFTTTAGPGATTIALEIGNGVVLGTCTGAPSAQLNTTGNVISKNYFHAVTQAVKVTCGALNVFENNAIDWVTSPTVTGFEIAAGDANSFRDNYVEVSGNRYLCTSGNGNKIYGLNHPGGQGTNSLSGCGNNTLIFDPHTSDLIINGPPATALFRVTGAGGVTAQTIATTSLTAVAAAAASNPIIATYLGGTRQGRIYVDANGVGFFGELGTGSGLYVNEAAVTTGVRAGGIEALTVGATTVAIVGGTNVVYRCATAGALPVGALTITAASCGTTADTGLRIP